MLRGKPKEDGVTKVAGKIIKQGTPEDNDKRSQTMKCGVMLLTRDAVLNQQRLCQNKTSYCETCFKTTVICCRNSSNVIQVSRG